MNKMKAFPCFCLVVAAIAIYVVESTTTKILPTVRADGISQKAGGTSHNGGKIGKQFFIGSGSFSTTFPWAGSVNVNSGLPPWFTALWCSASLLSSSWLVTAGICTSPRTNISVILGAVDRTDLTQPNALAMGVSGTNVYPHPKFNPATLENNIGLIKLHYPAPVSTPLLPNPFISGISLPKPTDILNTLIGQSGLVSGGLSTLTSNITNILNWSSQRIISNIDCAKFLNSTLPLLDTNICLVNNLADSVKGLCKIESGSPLVVRNPIDGSFTLQGIASYSPIDCLNKNAPFVYTSLAKYLPWINTVTGGTLGGIKLF